jgi:hypothetical protein
MDGKLKRTKNKRPGKKLIPNNQERKRVIITLIGSLILLTISYSLIPVILKYYSLHTDAFISFHQYIGSLARIGFFFSVAIYPVYLLLKYRDFMDINFKGFHMKSVFRFLAKLARQWHVPVALLSIGTILIHAYLAIINGIKLNGGYISGFIALGLLAILSFSGIYRYKKIGKIWHLTLGLLFVTAFIIHTLFSPTV